MTDIPLRAAEPFAGHTPATFLGGLAVWLGAFLGGFVIAEPAPYELYMVGLVGIWILAGLAVPRSAVLLLLLLVAFNAGGILAMFQMEPWGDAPLYLAVSLFLGLTSVFFASVIAARPDRLKLIFSGWTAAAVLTGTAGIAGYLQLVPGAEAFTLYGRAKGAFQDPNVFAPYLVLPAIYCLHEVLTRRTRHAAVPFTLLAVLTLAIFLSFSRGGWGLYLLCIAMLVALLFLSGDSRRFRIRLALSAMMVFAAILAVLAIALQFETVRDLFVERARLFQDYDAGRYGRFGRHLIGLLDAMEQPFGIGPLQFGRIYGEDTHNIWLKALFDYSWLGFAAYVTMVVLTLAGGLRILFRDRPWQPYLLCAYVVFAGHVAIGNIIDTDHWRHFYILLGIVWGCVALEARHARMFTAKPTDHPTMEVGIHANA